MSVKDFFAFAYIKISVVEYLKQKADSDRLSQRHKKPFRAYINKHMHMNDPINPEDDYFASDGFNSIRCSFSNECKETFAR